MDTEKGIKLYVQDKDLVVPGDLVGEGELDAYTPYLYVDNGRIYSTVVGAVEVVSGRPRIIPFYTTYVPQPGDVIIGVVVEVGQSYWTVDINSPYEAQLNVSETLLKPVVGSEALRKYLDVGEHILARVLSFERNKEPLLTLKGRDLGKIGEGKVVEFRSSRTVWSLLKRRRVINVIEEKLGVSVLLCANGRAWVRGGTSQAQDLAILALKRLDYTPYARIMSVDVSRMIDELRGA